VNAEHSRGGPPTTDRPTAENPDEESTPEGTTVLRQRPAGCMHLGTVVGRGGGVNNGLMPECAQVLVDAALALDHPQVTVVGARAMDLQLEHCPAVCAALFDGRWSA